MSTAQRRTRTSKPFLVVLLLLSTPGLTATGGPQPPCGVAAAPAYPTPAAPPVIKLWRGDDLKRSGWKPADCLGWASPSHTSLIFALAGSFRFAATADELVARIGAISTLRSVRYWSVTDNAWRPLVIDASALSRPDPRSRRPDFLTAEMTAGSELYYWENDSRTGKVVHRMAVRESSPKRVVIATQNITPIRLFLVTLFEAGALQGVEFLERVSPGVWGVYLLARADEGSTLASGHDASFVNRAVAIYRHLARIPTDQEPPAVR